MILSPYYEQNLMISCLLLVLLLQTRVTFGIKPTIHICALVPDINNGPRFDWDRFSFEAALTLAEELINEDDNILPDYDVKLTIKDTHHNKALTLNYLYEELYNDDINNMAVIGPGFSEPTKAAAEVTTKRGVLQITFSALDPSLSDVKKYPYFFRSVPSVLSINKANVKLLQYFNWQHVSLIFDYSNDLNVFAIENLSQEYLKNDIKKLSISGFTSQDPSEAFQNQCNRLEALDSRIIVGSFQNYGARKIFCEAFKRKLYGRKYVWLLPLGLLSWNWYEDQITTEDDTNCTVQEILTAAEGHLLFANTNLRRDGRMTAGNKSADYIWEQIRQRKRKSNPTLNFTENSPLYYRDANYAYDALLALATVFDKATKSPYNINFTEKRRSNQSIAETLSSILQSIQLEGVTGTLVYDGNRERISEVTLKQWRNGSYVVIGYTQNGEIHFLPGEVDRIFPLGVPRDRAIIKRQLNMYSGGLLISIWVMAILGILLAVTVAGFHLTYRNIEYEYLMSQWRIQSIVKVFEGVAMKTSTPIINLLISIGSLLCYVSIILHGVDSRLVYRDTNSVICNITSSLLVVGFILSFGGLFSKTWRIYQLYTVKKMSSNKNVLNEKHLMGIVFVLTVINGIILLGWLTLYPFKLVDRELDRTEDVAGDIIHIPILQECRCEHQFYFMLTLYIFNGLLILFGIFLAWETRSVVTTAVNDSKFNGMSIYNTSMIAIIGVVASQALRKTTNYEATYAIFAISVWLSSTVTLLIIFIPKAHMFYTKSTGWVTHSNEKSKSISRTRKLTDIGKQASFLQVPSPDMNECTQEKSTEDTQIDDHEGNRSAGNEDVVFNPAEVYLGPEDSFYEDH